jgi:predicted HAD superfamily phosphohydrolase YqeG
MKPGYMRCGSQDQALRAVAGLAAATLVIDVEPLIAHWDTGQQALDRGLRRILAEVEPLPAVRLVCFSTNSRRRPSFTPASQRFRVLYLALAGKPFRTAHYRMFPAPGALIGDQILTDGLLARRLGYTFVHYQPAVDEVPAGPWLLNRFGHLILRLLFPGADAAATQPPRTSV